MAAIEEKPMSNTAAIQECGESAAGVFWPVFLTLMVVFAAMLIVYFFWKYYWRIRHGKHLVLVTDVEKAEPEFAFDNPGFREGTPVVQAKKLSADAKENTESKENPHMNGHKPQSLEDGALDKSGTDQKTNVIALKSRDFTGLGFDICGNMRDGIYVKDLLHHGPASETGMIKPGDRISAIRINFSHMVYEDAKAILSCASPYEVEIEVEDGTLSGSDSKNSLPNHATNSFYRSQSFSTAQQIQKIIPRKLNFNSEKKSDTPVTSKPAVLEVSEIADKMSKYGVKVLPDIKAKSTVQNSTPPVTFEMQQNATIIDIQSDSGIDTKTPTSFDEVDLSPMMSNQEKIEKPNPLNTFKDNNMKTILVKGIQNLKEKLNNHIQKSSEKLPKEPEGQKIECKKIDEHQSPKLSITSKTEIELKPQEDINLRLRSGSISSNEADDLAAKKSKRKAPLPPITLPDIEKDSEFNLLNEIENEVNKNNYDCKDSDSETETDINTIELNASHITVHHIPEESNRKAASLGDLSKITDTDSPVPLERAVSLELTEHTPRGSKKRKAPLPPEENASNEDLFPKDSKSDIGMTKLKKSSLFGTLEESFKKDDDSSSIISDSNDNLLTSSTPMKIVDDDKHLSMDSCSNISWELNFDLQDESKDSVFLDDEKVPDLPTSPMPNLPTYVTEIKVSNGDESDMSKVNISDVTLFITAAEITEHEISSSESNHSKDESKTLEFIDEKTPNGLSSNHISDTIKENSISSIENSTDCEDSKDDSSIDTVKEITYTNGISEDHSVKVTSVETKNTKNLKFSKENMSDEQILALNSTTPNLKYSKINNGETVTGKIKSPNSMNKLPKLSQSVSPVKAAGSRIPIRANTEPSLKVSLINKDDIVVAKPRKYKLSEDGIENGKPVTFASSNHLPSSAHKTSVLSESRHNGPNR